MLTISNEKEIKSGEAEHRFTRKDYDYSSFGRNFTLSYNDGDLVLYLLKKEEAKNKSPKTLK